MLFSSFEFIFLFLPVTLALYYAAPMKLRNFVLLVMSIIFYGWDVKHYILLMLATIALDYAMAIAVSAAVKRGKRTGAKWLLALTVVLNLAILGFFKYFGFAADIFSSLTGISVSVPQVTLPVGISFYTFQSLSYVIDVYRQECAAQLNPVTFGAYVTMYPQLIAGPIVRYVDVEKQLQSRTHSFAMFADGIRIFTVGLAKKVLLANPAGEMWKHYLELHADERSFVGAVLGVVFFTFQIYFDFSGYSDMAVGLGKMLGFEFCINFNYPYTAKSIQDFWRRWHISLSTWFREYVYIPLGGNRCSIPRHIFNLFAVWSLTGLWHGASYNFVLWGVFYFVLLTLEKYVYGKALAKLPSFVQRIYTLFFVAVGWLIFEMTSAERVSSYLPSFVGSGGFANSSDLWEIARNALFIVILAVGSTTLPKRLWSKMESKTTATAYISIPLCMAAIILCCAYLASSGFNPFLYFRF